MQGDDEDVRDQQNRVALIVIIVLVAIAVTAMLLFHRSQNAFDCIAAGHKNCAPINISQ